MCILCHVCYLSQEACCACVCMYACIMSCMLLITGGMLCVGVECVYVCVHYVKCFSYHRRHVVCGVQEQGALILLC